jgi:hypothetical protein
MDTYFRSNFGKPGEELRAKSVTMLPQVVPARVPSTLSTVKGNEVRTMKHFIPAIVGCLGFALIGSSASAQQAMSLRQLDAIVKTDLSACPAKAGVAMRAVPVIPAASTQAFAQDRIENTLNGVWRGRVWGAYPKKFLTRDKRLGAPARQYLNVDYYWIVDVKRGEALVLEQLSNKRTVGEPPQGASTLSFLMCGEDQYLPRAPRQVHEFQKVSNTLEDARSILEKSTGLKVAAGDVVLSDFWKMLVEQKYFDTHKYPAYAGGFFKSFKLARVADAASGATHFSMKLEAEYRGSGATAAKFETGVPITGTESVEFLGVTASSGDFLHASIGNGIAWAKTAPGVINMSMDKVTLGPLQ